jgi:hypothetical protein
VSDVGWTIVALVVCVVALALYKALFEGNRR